MLWYAISVHKAEHCSGLQTCDWVVFVSWVPCFSETQHDGPVWVIMNASPNCKSWEMKSNLVTCRLSSHRALSWLHGDGTMCLFLTWSQDVHLQVCGGVSSTWAAAPSPCLSPWAGRWPYTSSFWWGNVTGVCWLRYGTLRQFSRKQHFTVPAQTQRTHVQRLSPKNKGVSPSIPLQAGYRSKKQGLVHRWLYLILLATLVLRDFPLPGATWPSSCSDSSGFISLLCRPYLPATFSGLRPSVFSSDPPPCYTCTHSLKVILYNILVYMHFDCDLSHEQGHL
jgi:hypothetical protein